ncbi:MAG: hypothetical protein WKH64_19045 [Chloroflexia bacterium]
MVSVQVLQVDPPTPRSSGEGAFQTLTAHIGVGGDPDYLRRWYAGEEANFAQGSIFNNAEFDRLGEEQTATLDPAHDAR